MNISNWAHPMGLFHLTIRSFKRVSLLTLTFLVCTVNFASADVLAEFLFWDSMGKAAGSAVKNYNELKAQRQLWKQKIAENEAKLKACENCPEQGRIKQELNYWRNTENTFEEFMGRTFLAVGMPRSVAKALDIDMSMSTATPEEIRESLKVVRPSWADDRPEFCQETVDKYVNCLREYKARHNTLFTGVAKGTGGECYDLRKLFLHCGAENYQAYDAEVELQKKRAAGEIIPDYLDWANEVYFGEVPDDFLPSVPVDVVLKRLEEIETNPELRFSMRKKKAGLLALMTVTPLRPNEIDPYNRCRDIVDPPTNEIALRECDDLYMLSWKFKTPVLSCSYSEADLNPQSFLDAIRFWYIEPPDYADAEHLLSRSSDHPLLYIGETRTECPATLIEAENLQAEWLARASQLRVTIPQIDESIDLPKPEWLVDKLPDRHKVLRAQEMATVQHRRAMKTFPLTGLYSFETTIDGETASGRCAIIPYKLMAKDSFWLHCRHPHGEFTEAVSPNNGYLYVTSWQFKGKQAKISYHVDEADPRVLVGRALFDKATKGRLVRLGDLKPFADIPLEGIYRYERSSAMTTDSGRCTITRDRRKTASHVRFQCTSDNGKSFDFSPKGNQTLLSIYWPKLDGSSTSMRTVFIADVNHFNPQEEAPSLLGWNNNGWRVHLAKIGALPTEPEPGSREAQKADDANKKQAEALRRKQEALEKRRQKLIAKQREVPPATNMKTETAPPLTDKRCTPEEIAGTYRTGFGPLVCTPTHVGLDCCYSNKCRKKAKLIIDATGRNMTGTWEEPSRSGPVIFPVSPHCELKTGRWNFSGQEDKKTWGTWRVTKRQK